jgi:hypothetical protein
MAMVAYTYFCTVDEGLLSPRLPLMHVGILHVEGLSAER